MTARKPLPPSGYSLASNARLAVIACTLLMGCGPAVSQTHQPDQGPTAIKPSSAPKPKPCEEMSEDCSASGDTQAKIPGSDFVFIPPAGWGYAQESAQTLAKAKAGPAALAVTGYDAGSASDEAKVRELLLPKLAGSIGVALPETRKKKAYAPTWDKPEATEKYGELSFDMWEAEDAKLGDRVGPLLVFSTKDSTGKKLLGVAFSLKGDDATINLIKESLKTFGPGSYQ